jgi:hypothetical protein
VDIYYLKDESTVSGQDAGWLDELVLTPITTEPVVTPASIIAYGNTALRHQIIATNAPISFNAVGLPAGLILSTTTGLIYGSTNLVGSHAVTIEATNDFGIGSAVLTLIVGSLSEGLAAAIDAPSLTITSSDTLPWRPQSLYSHAGNDAARSGDIQDLQNSEMTTSVVGPAKLTFYWGISSEADYDYLRFYIDDVEQEAISGEVGWTFREHILPAGTHTLKWAYIKDDYVRSGLDSGFVDELQLYSDADADGFWVDEEAAFGTSDMDANVKPWTSITAQSPTSTNIEFPSVNGRQYRVQHSSDLQTWISVPIIATGTVTSWSDTTVGSETRRFYRVVTP